MFVNRKKELEFLKMTLEKDSFQLVPVWGRRRIGKTALLVKALGKGSFYFLAVESSPVDNLINFRRGLFEYLKDETILHLELDWEVLFKYISNENMKIIIDEFPYLIEGDPSIPSRFQKIVDTVLQDTNTKLYLCGSSIRMMESYVLSYSGPLYGRRTGQIDLRPLKFRYLREFLPDYDIVDLIRVYGMCGGIPSYILQFDPERPLWDNVYKVFLDRFSFMYGEEGFLLKQEFKNISKYRSILGKIASGRTKIGEVRDLLSMKRSDITPYLSNLMNIRLIRREVPVTDDPGRSRSGIYKISDQYLRFYYNFLQPRADLIETENSEAVLKWIKKEYDVYLGLVFEEVVKEVFEKWCSDRGIMYDNIGRWWHGEDEIDLVGLNSMKNSMILTEIKWSRKKRSRKDVEVLFQKRERIRWGNDETEVSYLYVSRGGFTETCLDWMDEIGILHWDLHDIEKVILDNN